MILLTIPLFLNADILKPYDKIKKTALKDKLIKLSRKAIKTYLKDNKIIKPDFTLSESWPGNPCGIFVTLVKNNRVRGCVGAFFPRESSFLEEIIRTSIEATYKDSRFDPISIGEVDEIEVIITVVGEKQSVDDPYSVNLMEYGLLIKKDNRASTLLPGEARTAAWGIKEILKKSNINNLKGAEYFMFETITYDERKKKKDESIKFKENN